jgi:hypothetical protein
MIGSPVIPEICRARVDFPAPDQPRTSTLLIEIIYSLSADRRIKSQEALVAARAHRDGRGQIHQMSSLHSCTSMVFSNVKYAGKKALASRGAFAFLLKFYLNFGAIYAFLGYLDPIGRGCLMIPAIFLLRLGLWALCLVLGSLGVFFAIISLSLPGLSADALVLLGAALGINYFLNT